MLAPRLIILFTAMFTAPAVLAGGPSQRFVLPMRGLEANDFRPPVVTAVGISPDGTRVVAGGDDHAVRVWDATTGEPIRTLDGHHDWVRATRFAGGADRFASVGADHTVCLWSLTESTGQIAARRLTEGSLQAVAWRPDGMALATAGFGDALRVFDLTDSSAEPKQMSCACEDTRAVAYSPDGRWIAAAGRNGVVRVWDTVGSGGPRDLSGDGRRVRSLVFSPDGETLAAGGDGPTIRLWRLAPGAASFGGQDALPEELLVRPGKVHTMAFLSDSLLAAGGTSNAIRVWDTDTRSQRATLEGHTGTVAAVAVTADGRRIVSGSFDTTVRVWDIDPAALPAAVVAQKKTKQNTTQK